MLSHLWRTSIGSAVIDVFVDTYSQTVSVGDVSGNSYIFDYYGNSVAEYESDMPIWGVAHTLTSDGTIVFASAHADKANGTGRVEIYEDDTQLISLDTKEPIWDVCLLSNFLLATGWKGGLYVFNLESRALIERIDLGKPLYGVCKITDDTVLINAEKDGIYEYSIGGGCEKLATIKNCCYNISHNGEQGIIVTGSHGPYVFATTLEGVVVAKKEAKEVFSVAATANFIITGTKSGDLSIWSTIDSSREIYFNNQGAEIWNIAYDERQGHIFLALGDGTVSCINVDQSSEQTAAIEKFLRSSKGKKDIDLIEAINDGIPSTIVIPNLIQLINDGFIDGVKAKTLLAAIDDRISRGDGDYCQFSRSILFFSQGNYQSAISGFQVVDTSHPYYSLAVILLAKSLIATGDYDSARQYIVTNVSSIEKRYVPEAMAVLDSLGVASMKSLERRGATKTATYKPLVGDASKKEIFQLASSTKGRNEIDKSLDYGVINYIKYEYPNRADHAKKILEKNIVESYLRENNLPSDGKPISLDIGCATCRYPIWLSENGFFAVGYDIDDDAIKICQMRSEGNKNVRIEKKNILDHEPEHGRYSLITCMMGTFNHIPIAEQGKFCRWIFDSLRAGGVFIFSSWNRECPYTSHLHFYNREEREYIQKNTRTPSNTESMLRDAGFIISQSVPIAFFPDECYEAWLGEISENQVIETDQNFRNILNGTNSQMYVFCVVKP
jgi:2-polyprenyl-3-methyl-5-hydroxy-6-metoxy-1,4-benzoquinol methylase